MSLAQAGQVTGRFDLTISDRGVTAAPVQQPAIPVQQPRLKVEPQAEVQVTSNRALQELLSPEETQALRENFLAQIRTAQSPGEVAEARVYSLRGVKNQARTAAAVGRLVDFSG